MIICDNNWKFGEVSWDSMIFNDNILKSNEIIDNLRKFDIINVGGVPMEIKIKKEDMYILQKLLGFNAINPLQAKSIKFLSEELDINNQKIRRQIKRLLDCEFVTTGYYADRSSTYYVTSTGMNVLKEDIIKTKELIPDDLREEE